MISIGHLNLELRESSGILFIYTKISVIMTEPNQEKKRCPTCRCMKSVDMFYGIRKQNTYKCNNCIMIASKNSKKNRILQKERDRELEEMRIIQKYLDSKSN